MPQESRHGKCSTSVGECLQHFGTPNRKYIAQALAREELGPVELVYDETPCSAYAGSGVPIAKHPMRSYMERADCRSCQSGKVLVVGAETTSTMGGDTYLNFVVRCEECGSFSSFSDEL